MRFRVIMAAAVAVGLTASFSCAPDAVLVVETSPQGGSGGVVASGGAGGQAGMPATCDDHTNLPAGPCDVMLQDCPPPNRCAPLHNGNNTWSTTCIAPKGGKLSGEACQDGECEWGLTCIYGHCSPACCVSTNEGCGDNQYCYFIATYGPYFLRRCVQLSPCDLFSPTACVGADPPGVCQVVVGFGATACKVSTVEPPLQEGEVCSTHADCGASLLCVTDPTHVCRYSCYLDGSGSGLPGEGGCPVGQACIQTTFIGVDNIGICRAG